MGGFFPAGWSWSAQSVQQHAAEDPRQQVQLRQLPLLGQLRNDSPPPPFPKGCVCVHMCVNLKRNLKKNRKTQYPHSGQSWASSPRPTSLHLYKSSLSLLGSLFPPFSKLVVHVRYLCMYLYKYIYTVYVIVEHEMWLLHFIFEGLLFTFFKTAGKDVTLRQNDMIMRVRERVKKIKDLKLM